MAQFSLNIANGSVNGVATVASTDEATAAVTTGTYLIVISGGGTGTAINFGAAASALMPTFNAGAYGPYLIVAGTGDSKIHAFAQAAGRVDLVPCTPTGAP